jgi:hypothetical protein
MFNGKGPANVLGQAQPDTPHLELENGRKVELTAEEALRLELLDTQGKLFDAQMQILARGKQEVSSKGQEIIAAAIERDRAQHAAELAGDEQPDTGEVSPAPA